MAFEKSQEVSKNEQNLEGNKMVHFLRRQFFFQKIGQHSYFTIIAPFLAIERLIPELSDYFLKKKIRNFQKAGKT